MSKAMQLEMVELRYKARQAVCPESRPNRDTNSFSSLSSCRRAMCAGGWGALGTCLALVYLGVLWLRHLAGHRSWASTLQKVLRNTLANGVFPTRIPLHSMFCQGMPKSTLKNNLAPGMDSSLDSGQFEPEKVHRLQHWAAAVTFWMEIWMWGNSNRHLGQEASEKRNRVHRDSIRELKEEAKTKAWPLCLQGWSAGSLYRDHQGSFLFCFKCRYLGPTLDPMNQGVPLLGSEVWISRNGPR